MKQSIVRSIVSRARMGIGLIAFVVAAESAWPAVFTYFAEHGTLPAAQGWGVAGTQGASGTQSITNGNTLVVTDTDAGNRALTYTNTPVVTSATDWQMRAVLRLNGDYVSALGQALYTQIVLDNTQSSGFGVRHTTDGSGSNQVFFIVNFPNSLPASSFINIPLGQFYEVVVTKTTGINELKLEVYDPLGMTLLGSRTSTYTGNTGYGNLGGPELDFGHFNAQPTGTYELKWASFGIGEAAPFFVPEPSAALLAALGGLLAWSRRRPAKA